MEEPKSRKIVFVSGDVMFWARVHAAAKAAGSEAVRVGDEAGMAAAARDGGVSRVILDLGFKAVDAAACAARFTVSSPRPQLVAFGSHVDENAMTAAKDAGFDVVMPNSRFHRTLAEWVA
jgi:DNA-binding NarL/FixJ family response regulator